MGTQRLDFSVSYPRITKRYKRYAAGRPDVQNGQAQMLKSLSSEPNMRAVVSIVIYAVNDAERDALKDCLFAITNRTRGIMYEIIVAGVGDAPRIEAARPFKWVPVVKGEKASSAINTAVSQATGHYLAIVDPFARVRIGWIRPLMACAEDDATVFAVGAHTLDSDGRIVHVGVELSANSSTRQLLIGDLTSNKKLAEIQGLSAVLGGVVLFRAADFHAHGGLIANSFGQEAIGELCMRLVATGGRLEIASNSVCYTKRPVALDLYSLEKHYDEIFLVKGHLEKSLSI